MLRVPLPGVPGAGKCDLEYLNSPDSMAISAKLAACAPLEVILYLEKAAAMKGAAWSAVLHSSAYGAPLQDAELGMIALIIAGSRVEPPAAGAEDGAAEEASEAEATLALLEATGATAREEVGDGAAGGSAGEDASGAEASGAGAAGDGAAGAASGINEETGSEGVAAEGAGADAEGYPVIITVVVMYKIPLETYPWGP